MYAHILVAVDPDTATSYSEALPQAVGLARAHGATLHVLTVVPDFGSSWVAGFFPADFEKKALAQAEKALQQLISSHVPADLPHQLVVAHDRIYKEVCRVAEVGADLIVMASHKPTAQDRLIAPNAQQVLQHTSVSVLIVR
ncbi:MAG: universal stress protein [Geminicoccaceae bacterium]